jgi:hypothetical protein
MVEVYEERNAEKQVLQNSQGFRERIREFFANLESYKTQSETLLTCNFRVVSFSQSIF